jgi:hypothetical protein
MNHDHHAAALIGTMASWGLFFGSLVVSALPYMQFLSLALAMTASVYAIRYYRARTTK